MEEDLNEALKLAMELLDKQKMENKILEQKNADLTRYIIDLKSDLDDILDKTGEMGGFLLENNLVGDFIKFVENKRNGFANQVSTNIKINKQEKEEKEDAPIVEIPLGTRDELHLWQMLNTMNMNVDEFLKATDKGDENE